MDTDLFSGMYPLLEELEAHQIPWGIVTNKPRGLSELLLVELNLTERCSVLVCPEDVSKTKPDPEPMYLAARQLNLPSEHIIYVGDHPRDIDAGRAAKMYTILPPMGICHWNIRMISKHGKPMPSCRMLLNYTACYANYYS